MNLKETVQINDAKAGLQGKMDNFNTMWRL